MKGTLFAIGFPRNGTESQCMEGPHIIYIRFLFEESDGWVQIRFGSPPDLAAKALKAKSHHLSGRGLIYQKILCLTIRRSHIERPMRSFCPGRNMRCRGVEGRSCIFFVEGLFDASCVIYTILVPSADYPFALVLSESFGEPGHLLQFSTIHARKIKEACSSFFFGVFFEP